MENQQLQQQTVDTRIKDVSKKTKKREYKNRKTFSLKAMEALVDRVSFLENKYDSLAINAKEKLGYHYNEILNILLFHKYVKSNKKLFEMYKKIKDAINKGYEFKKEKRKKVQENTMKNMMKNNEGTHFAINKKTNKILESWNYNGYEHNELKNHKDEYFTKDIRRNYPFLNENDIVVVKHENLQKRNLNENNKKDWQKYNYSHFALLKETNHILYGYDYSDVDSNELTKNKNKYFLKVLSEQYGNEITPKDVVVVKSNKLKKLGIKDYLNESNWVGLINEAYCGSKMEEDMQPTNNTHFAVTKDSNKILFGWDYSDVDPEELRRFKNDYFFNDIRDMFDDYSNVGNVLILTRKSLEKRGLNPNDTNNWMQNVNEDVLDESTNSTNVFGVQGQPVQPGAISLKRGQNIHGMTVNMKKSVKDGLEHLQDYGVSRPRGKGNMKIDPKTGIVNPDRERHEAGGGSRFKVNENTNSLIDLNALMDDEIQYRKSESRTPENKFKSPRIELIRENNRDSISEFIIKYQGRELPEVYNRKQLDNLSLKTLNEYYNRLVQRLGLLEEEKKHDALVRLDALKKQSQKDTNNYYKKDASNKTTTMLVQKGEGDGLVYDKDSLEKKDIPKYQYQSEHQKQYLEKGHRGLEDFVPEPNPNGETDPVWLARKEALMSTQEVGAKAFKDAQKRIQYKKEHGLGKTRGRTVKLTQDLPKVDKADELLKESSFDFISESNILNQIQSYYIDEDNRKKPVIFDANNIVEKFNKNKLMGCKELTYKGLGQTLTEDFKNKVSDRKLLYSPESKKVYLV